MSANSPAFWVIFPFNSNNDSRKTNTMIFWNPIPCHVEIWSSHILLYPPITPSKLLKICLGMILCSIKQPCSPLHPSAGFLPLTDIPCLLLVIHLLPSHNLLPPEVLTLDPPIWTWIIPPTTRESAAMFNIGLVKY